MEDSAANQSKGIDVDKCSVPAVDRAARILVMIVDVVESSVELRASPPICVDAVTFAPGRGAPPPIP